MAAQAIAARLGASIEPDPFDPVLRGALIAEERTEYLRSAIQEGDVASAASRSPLWAPAAKVAGRYLAAHLQRVDRQRR